ncbi:MAG: outer membrane beta-barrel protein [Bacteroidota bacterium]
MSTFFYRSTTFLLLALFSITQINAQDQRFKAGLIAGFNLSQLDGDQYQGFDKFGLHVGVRGVAIISPRVEISTEILLSQKGSRFEDPQNISRDKVQKINLNYMLVPILFNYLGGYSKEKDLFRSQYSFGVSIGRLIGTEIEENTGDDINFTDAVDLFNKSDFSALIGYTYYLDHHIGLGVRVSLSTNLIFDVDETPLPDDNELRLLRSYLVSGRAIYMF